MTVTAVVLSYWPNRLDNVLTIVRDLHDGSTVKPDHTIVLLQGHNAMAHIRATEDWWFDGRVEVIRTAGNYHTRAKFVAGLLHVADHYLLMDDDTSVNRLTLDCLVRASRGADDNDEPWVTGYWGVTLSPDKKFIDGGTIHQPVHARAPFRVDGFHGRVIFANHAALTLMFERELKLRQDDLGQMCWPDEGDDIIIGMATGAGWVIPMRGEEWFKDLDQCGQALQFETEAEPGDEHYFAMRDRFTQHVARRMVEGNTLVIDP